MARLAHWPTMRGVVSLVLASYLAGSEGMTGGIWLACKDIDGREIVEGAGCIPSSGKVASDE